ncbi:thiol S-methyltransferase TMT1A-like [Genypterus blacodes]|uniref:thiol S-methyltransferase TMT1A-like n=1 Tax=Genypterus blacodes TaxID=154954 RepID=UPI003F757A44
MAMLMRFCVLLVNVLCLPLYLLEAIGLNKFYKRAFPFCLHRLSESYNKKMREKKKDLFRSIPEFRNPAGHLRILEIGCGTGTNFEFYPAGCKVTCTDPNPHFQKFLQKSMANSSHLTFDSFVVAAGEDLGSIEDNSVDVVVCTLVLCSVDSAKQTLLEVQRILRPGGAFFFMEHVLGDASSWIYFFQHVLQPVFYFVGDGCDLTRTTWKELEAAGFSDLKLRHLDAPLYFIIRPHISGYAVK